jgi:alanyl-tRNA synthetase
MTSEEIRSKFLNFFHQRGHALVPSSSLVPVNDPSVLFTTAGMQQFKPYYIGQADVQKDFGSLNVVSAQKCVRTSDIEEVGDERHLTFFEMLGNFSFGGYFKKEAIHYAHEFITKELGLTIDYVSVFAGEAEVPADEESILIWQELDSKIVIKKFGRDDNFWGPTGEEGPCGPTTEIYAGGIEIWNIVFNQYYQEKNKTLKPLATPGIDTGMGLERLAMVCQKKDNVFETDLLAPMMGKIEELSINWDLKSARIVADHLRASSVMIADGVIPSNTGRGYVLRRLIRRVVLFGNKLGISDLSPLNSNNELTKEIDNFKTTVNLGIKKFDNLTKTKVKEISGLEAFMLFSSYGLPIDMTMDLAKEKNLTVDIKGFEEQFKKHQELSRAGAEQKFKGGLAGGGERETKYHTATHLLHQALRTVLGNQVQQKGSNITAERLRFDFVHPAKMTDEEKEKVEEIINEKIKANLSVQQIVLSRAAAEKTGALHFFADKYGEQVSVYFIGANLENAYSKEFCGGPHVKNTSELGRFKIIKEEAVAAGIRRIKAVLESDNCKVV